MTKYHTIERAGWLLACDAPHNQNAGRELLATLTGRDRAAAENRAVNLVRIYREQGSAAYRANTVDHPYAS